ncbi:hypothetical protein CHF27_010785 [Romboutsia maritimum]|uniref:Uncharacterized protein n=1 Tax=Romboutsia maritimum TaxID=2020948 RepID=A0A371IQY0_9FIRM|nr:hypothetical protein CHF27_010785 [Romboutsia maritimum]
MKYELLDSIKRLCYSFFQLATLIILLSIILRDVELTNLENILMIIAFVLMTVSNTIALFLNYKKQ